MSFVVIFFSLISCAQNEVKERAQERFNYVGSLRLFHKDEKWVPEENCKKIQYIKVKGEYIDSSDEGYDEAIYKLTKTAKKFGATTAVVRDYTDRELFAYLWFCSDSY